jgi:hypothetical protein
LSRASRPEGFGFLGIFLTSSLELHFTRDGRLARA